MPNFPIELRTFNLQRARLNGNVTGPIGPLPAIEFPNINRDGFFLLSGTADAFTNALSRAPFTRLHLVDNAVNPTNPVVYAQQHGFRPWQRNGVTFTGNSDQSYIGHRYAGNDNTDFVVQWSDNPNGSPWGTDRMKFVFTTQFDPVAPRGAATLDGLEAMRLWPRNNNEVNVGIGDFAPPAVGDPTERVDMLNGRLRIRQLPDDAEHTGPYRVMVVDDSPAPSVERGVVKWAALPLSPGAPDCDWDLDAPNNRMTTSWRPVGSTVNCPELDWRVGIGTSAPTWKLDVRHDASTTPGFGGGIYSGLIGSGGGAVAQGIRANVTQPSTLTTEGQAIRGEYNDPGTDGFGVLGRVYVNRSDVAAAKAWAIVGETTLNNGTVIQSNGARFITYCNGGTTSSGYGLQAETDAASGTPIGNSYGVWGRARKGSILNYGVYGEAVGTMAYAGYFAGDVFTTGQYLPSDGQLKTIVEEADAQGSESPDVLSALTTRRFVYNTSAFPQMNLPEGEHLGFLAQELEEVLPHLVQSALQPATVDGQGNELTEAVAFKAVNYTGLIPYLVAGHQSQRSEIQELRDQIAAMQAQLAACCAAPPADSDQRSGSVPAEEKLTPAQERLLRIAPNPFTDRTTLYCTLERAGRMQLMANSSDGRDLRMLSEGQREAGEFQYEWSTEHLAPGVYYVTLLLNGEPVVKRAVKVGR